MTAKEIILKRVMKDVESNNDIYWILTNLFRVYLENNTKSHLLKIINNIPKRTPKNKDNADFINLIQ